VRATPLVTVGCRDSSGVTPDVQQDHDREEEQQDRQRQQAVASVAAPYPE